MQICLLLCGIRGSVFTDDGTDITPTSFPTLRDLGVLDAQHRAAHKEAKGQTQECAESLSLASFLASSSRNFPSLTRSILRQGRKGCFSTCFSLIHTYSASPYFFLRAEFAESSVLQQRELFAINEFRSGRRRADFSSYFTRFNCTSSSCRVRLSFRSFLGFYHIENLGLLQLFKVETSRILPFKNQTVV